MALEFLLDQGNRIIEATVNNANRHITSLSRALRAQESITADLLVDLGQSDEVITIAMVDRKGHGDCRASSACHPARRHIEVQNELHRRQTEWNTTIRSRPRPDGSSHGDDGVKLSAPREVFRLTEEIEDPVERALAQWGTTGDNNKVPRES